MQVQKLHIVHIVIVSAYLSMGRVAHKLYIIYHVQLIVVLYYFDVHVHIYKNPPFPLCTDLVNNAYRPKEPTRRCTTFNHYIYSLKSVAESDQAKTFPIHKSIIRAHLQVIRRLLKPHPIRINITIMAKLLNQDRSQFVFAGQDQINVTAKSNGWVELNVTEGLNTLWPLMISNNTSENYNIEFLIKLEVDCISIKKVPAAFIEPTSIKLSQMKRRERHVPLQALLLVFLTDKDTKEIMKQEHQQNTYAQTQEELGIRTSRSAGSNSQQRVCHREDFMIQFSDLQLNYILVPVMYNAFRCSGSCSHEDLSDNPNLGTNHAKLMASAKFVDEIPESSVVFQRKPRDPYCSPTRYSSLTLLINTDVDVLEVLPYPSMTVTECGCR